MALAHKVGSLPAQWEPEYTKWQPGHQGQQISGPKLLQHTGLGATLPLLH